MEYVVIGFIVLGAITFVCLLFYFPVEILERMKNLDKGQDDELAFLKEIRDILLKGKKE